MQDSNEWKRIEFSNRLMSRIQKRGTRGSLIKSIAELIKNSDDSYYRMEQRLESVSGRIEVGYWYNTKKKRRVLTGFYVRDWAEGMSGELVRRAYETSGQDTSKGARSGAIGVGGKDALYGMRECYIISIRQGIPTSIQLRTSQEGVMEIKTTNAKVDIQFFNQRMKGVEPIAASDNGTIIFFTIPKDGKHPHFDKFKEDLSKYYTLRNILQDESRVVQLVDVSNGETSALKYEPIPGKVVNTSSFEIHHDGTKYPVDIIIKRCEKNLDKDREYGYNLLIQTDKGAVLDNTLFTYEDLVVAKKFFGTVTITNWRDLYAKDEMVMTDNREGLDYKNDFNKELQSHIMYFLHPLIENEDKNAGPKPELSGNLKKRILSAFLYINRIIEKEAGGGFSADEPVRIELDVEGLMFSQSVLNLHIGEEKQIRLYYNKKNIPIGSRINLTSSNDGIDFDPNELINESDREETYFSITIIGKNVDSQSILEAYSDPFEAKLIINILPLENLVLDNGFAFLPNEITLYTGKTRKLRLLYDSRLIKKGTIIRVTTGDNRIKLIKNRLEVEPPNINKFLVQALIEVKSYTPNIKSQILAKVKSTGDELKAICTVRTTEKDAPKKFFKDFRLDDKKDGRQRSSFENGIVYVHVNSPILKNYFGNKQERLNEKKEKDAIAILADTVLQCLARAMATYYVESGTVDSLSSKEVEIEYQRQNIEYEHGEVIHQMITKIQLNGKDKLN